uniref:Dehydrogenase E1 component domain-containing protein n=1 Tax=Parascaris equorum TaxID=6256 RepID=A0A914RFV2_PAREQ
YRTREEIQEVRKTRDPITGFKDKIVTAGLVTEDELKEVDKEIRKEVGFFLLLFTWMFILNGIVG